MGKNEKDLAVTVKELVVAYEDKIVLERISWSVQQGELAAVIGPNGGGKSTLLKSLLGLVPKVSGEISIFNKSPKLARQEVAYLPQAEDVDWLFPISSLDVVIQGRLVHLKWWQKPKKSDYKVAMECLSMVQMADYAHTPIQALSGGQKQRVFLARALSQEAKLIIMDEPATGLDAAVQHQLLDLFVKLQRLGHTVIITTHDLNCIAAHFDSVLGLNQQVILSGPPAKVLDAAALSELFAKHFPVIGPKGEVTLHDR